jgi:hypothetical protein
MSNPDLPYLTQRQIKFLRLCGRAGGCCPWLIPLRAPHLRDFEIEEMRKARVIYWLASDMIWRATPLGEAILAAIDKKEEIAEWRRKRRAAGAR